MFSNQPLPFQSTEDYLKRSVTNPRFSTSSASYFDENPNNFSSSPSARSSNYVPPNSNRKRTLFEPTRNVQSGQKTGGGAIEKTNMMSSENPFVDPARPYEHYKSPRTVTSITSPTKSGGGIVKSLNLSDENPFFDTYARYQYPSQIDPSKRITNQGATPRPIDTKSLHLSEENPFATSYVRNRYPSPTEPPKRTNETPKLSAPVRSSNNSLDETRASSYQPLTIREYSMSGITMNHNNNNTNLNSAPTFSSSIADWVRNHPAPLSYRPIEVRRSAQDFHSTSTSVNLFSAREPSLSSPRLITQRSNPSAPLEKTSLNMSPDNPFSDTYGRYHYPSADEIKAQKRVNERINRPIEPFPNRENRNKSQGTFPTNEILDNEKKEQSNNRSSGKFTRFDIDL